MVQKRETKAINKLCVREILSLSFVCGAYFFEFRGRNLVCFGIAYNFERMRTAFFTRVPFLLPSPPNITRFYILFEQTINVIESFAFSPG